MNYDEAMSYIHEVGNFGSNYGLERTVKLLDLIGNPHMKSKFIHVAGTNGKGSTTAILAEILKEKGFKVGMYTSPYLEEFEERIQINGENIPKDRLAQLVTKIKKAVDKVIEEGYNHPTEFEIITCLMFLYFAEEKIDYGVIEVGLGGRLDSTNVITPILSIITSISYDHMNLLGNTLGEIAKEKAGIIKENIPVVIYPQEEEAFKVIEDACFSTKSNLITTDISRGRFIKVLDEDRIYQLVNITFDEEDFEVKLPLLGQHQISNLLVALNAYKVLCNKENIKFSIEDIKSAVKKVKWIGRLEVMNKKPLIVIDGAHNIQGISNLKNNVEKYFKYNKIYLILGILADKEVEKMVKIIAPIAYKVYALTPLSTRAENASELKIVIDKYNNNCIAYESYYDAIIDALKEAEEDDLILVSGSLYMIGDMRKKIRNLINNKESKNINA